MGGASHRIDASQRPGGAGGFRRVRASTRFVIALLGALVLTAQSVAQETDPHSGHHPPADAAPAVPAPPTDPGRPTSASAFPDWMKLTPSGPPAAPVSEMGPGGMMEMMRGMMGAPQRQTYPAMMGLPDNSPTARAEAERLARERLRIGTLALLEASVRLNAAAAGNDPDTIRDTVTRLREALAYIDSGATAQRLLREGKEPSQVAREWIDRQFSVPQRDPSGEGQSIFGLSSGHLATMAGLAFFTVSALIIYLVRMRKVSILVASLAKGAAVSVQAGGGQSTKAAGPPPTDSERSPPPVTTAARPSVVPLPVADRPVDKSWPATLEVAAIFQETPTVKTFRVRPVGGGALPYPHHPGQFLRLSIEEEGQTFTRSYTIASAPGQRDYLEITVKREEQGRVSRYLHDRVKVGDTLAVSAPFGTFTFDGSQSDSIVLIGGGVGITPLMSVIRHLTGQAWAGQIFLLYAARTTTEFVFREELEYLQRRHANLHVIATMTRSEGQSWLGLEGRLTREVIAQSVPDISGRRIHLCGPPAMMEAMRAALAELGVPKSNLKTEAFATVAPPVRPIRETATSVDAVALPTVSFARSGKNTVLRPDQSVLEAAEAIGVAIDYSCRAGTCGTCKVRLLEGNITMEVEDGLEPADKANHYVLACQAKSFGNLVIEA